MILALVEHTGGRPERLSLEMLGLARRAGAPTREPIHAVLFGSGAAEAVGHLGGWEIEVAHVVEHDRLTDFAPVAWAASIAQLMTRQPASIVLAAGSDRGNEVMAHLGARTELPLAANCTDVVAGEPFRLTRQRWAGSLLEDAVLDAPTKLLTIAPHAVAIEQASTGADAASPAIRSFAPDLTDDELRVAVARRLEPDRSGISLTDARVVVGGGRGVGSPEAFAELEDLAGLLGGAVGVSRVVTSSGWRPHSQQIGQTGLRIAPDVYIACGISGAIQHIVGAKAAKRILAINTDPDAPIMAVADYAVIGDLHEVVPAISAEIRRVTGR
jgi:electron transfer flavoprotein alpha subunit